MLGLCRDLICKNDVNSFLRLGSCFPVFLPELFSSKFSGKRPVDKKMFWVFWLKCVVQSKICTSTATVSKSGLSCFRIWTWAGICMSKMTNQCKFRNLFLVSTLHSVLLQSPWPKAPVALLFLWKRYNFTLGEVSLVFSCKERLSLPDNSAIIHVFWKASFLYCCEVSKDGCVQLMKTNQNKNSTSKIRNIYTLMSVMSWWKHQIVCMSCFLTCSKWRWRQLQLANSIS